MLINRVLSFPLFAFCSVMFFLVLSLNITDFWSCLFWKVSLCFRFLNMKLGRPPSGNVVYGLCLTIALVNFVKLDNFQLIFCSCIVIAVLCLCSNNPTLVRSIVILSGLGHLGEPVVVNVFSSGCLTFISMALS